MRQRTGLARYSGRRRDAENDFDQISSGKRSSEKCHVEVEFNAQVELADELPGSTRLFPADVVAATKQPS